MDFSSSGHHGSISLIWPSCGAPANTRALSMQSLCSTTELPHIPTDYSSLTGLRPKGTQRGLTMFT